MCTDKVQYISALETNRMNWPPYWPRQLELSIVAIHLVPRVLACIATGGSTLDLLQFSTPAAAKNKLSSTTGPPSRRH